MKISFSKNSSLDTNCLPLAPRKGFTLIEILVVLVISAMLAGIGLSYNSASRKEIALTVEAAKISQFILRAESLAIATYGSNSASLVCGYGVSFDAAAQTYGIFVYQPTAAATCRDMVLPLATIASGEMQQYTPGTSNVHVASEVRLVSSPADSIAVVLFYPPTPTTYISHDGSTFPSPTLASKVYLTTADGSDSRTISVNPAGQVSF
jgi:prepilin-type N-terminal cleavage/methylation domain-containing protein